MKMQHQTQVTKSLTPYDCVQISQECVATQISQLALHNLETPVTQLVDSRYSHEVM